MKYFVILLISVLLLILSMAMTLFFWEIAGDWAWKAFMITCPALFLYLFVKIVLIYSKIQLLKNELRVSKAFTNRTYNLSELTSWTEETNTYRASYRKLELIFPQNKLTLFNHADRVNFEELYHLLRTNYSDRRLP